MVYIKPMRSVFVLCELFLLKPFFTRSFFFENQTTLWESVSPHQLVSPTAVGYDKVTCYEVFSTFFFVWNRRKKRFRTLPRNSIFFSFCTKPPEIKKNNFQAPFSPSGMSKKELSRFFLLIPLAQHPFF